MRCLQNARAQRGRDAEPKRDEDAGSPDRGQPNLHLVLSHQVLNRRALRKEAPDWGEVDCTHDDRTVIALLQLHPFHSFVRQPQVVAYAAIEYRGATVARFRGHWIAIAGDLNQRSRHWITDTTQVRFGNRNSIRRRRWRSGID